MTARTEASTSTYLRWGGLAAIIGPVLIMVGAGLGALLESGRGFVEYAETTTFFATTGAAWVGTVVTVFGLVSLYAAQAEEAGGLGLAGFLGALAGMVTFSGSLWMFTVVPPSLAVEAPDLLEQVSGGGSVTGPLDVAPLIAAVAVGLGMILFGIATWRAGVFSRVVAGALIVGALLGAVPLPFSDVVLALTLAWMGYQVFTGRVGLEAAVAVEPETGGAEQRTPEMSGQR